MSTQPRHLSFTECSLACWVDSATLKNMCNSPPEYWLEFESPTNPVNNSILSLCRKHYHLFIGSWEASAPVGSHSCFQKVPESEILMLRALI
jgi:hypothetical protein